MKHYLPDPDQIPGEAQPQELPPWGETRVVGRSLSRVDGYELVSGTAVYTLDLTLPDMLHAVIVRCPHAHARVVRVETSRAEAMPGVRAVLTASTPGAEIPWYFGDDGPTSRLFDSHCRYAGEEVAAVAAETVHQAWDAARAIEVEYEVLPFVIDEAEALEADAPAVHEGGNLTEQREFARGDVEAAFAEADVVLGGTFRTPCELHAPLETFVSVARWDGDRLTVWDSTQGVFARQQELARYFRLPLTSVRVICPYVGGGFGAKLSTGKYTVIAALAARMTARPVKLAVTREDSFLSEGNRPANTIRLKAAAMRDGTLTALEGEFLGSVGAYPSGAVSPYLLLALYDCANARAATTEVYTNAGRARAFRAPAFPPCAWALEQTIDALAEEIGMDPVEFRLKNLATVLQLRDDLPYTSIGLRECIIEGAREFGWESARSRPQQDGHLRRGVGMAAGMWAYPGEPRATVFVKLFADGSVNLNMGASDIGTGTKTVMAMVVAEELGVPLEQIQIEHADTGTTQYAPASGGSQTVVVSSPAVRAAAVDVKGQLLEIAAAELERPAEGLVLRDGQVVPIDDEGAAVPLAELRGLRQRQNIVGVGRRHPHPEGKIALPFCAQFADVEVNTLTGEVRVARLLAAHDSGRVMSYLTYENQVFGGMAMGIGFGLTEDRVLDSQTGKMVNHNWHDYKIPTAKDVPLEQTCVPIDPHDTECNTTGAKGLGEPAHIPTAAAIANAVYHATGVRVHDAPITAMQMVRLLAETRGD
ncbi:MAG: xanthine dehydrogenase family protein molybdopterin-binding subunit [Gemmatimonadetes bacterium]|uniref:Xanthine dehydrogenase family protein molybdopterin-binding subunit n=1 Tax=Candidatus Kutchimonas denitrificans TaxID=3056748 RepID=A0AAE5CB52_9BACT|nr:xanthine dehydrogenase family protein molybdopterin-binding subunit [Gemmatimonadota bacterium]NIR75347.1 xanthine dehydrogenase family protein molybdopterin-binding subunit [Candidatus Kutchimonas denitrificans]NIS00979.1 xanthine dehydrogenase family protein molybdopterin-binding subunit [Gemmatimonadota bacterium]NIT66606.1 xanthine dehydrogenase family protein molybdopterin-binding subunit [Gemmatimonadota bacterium]NIU53176.1 molybdopterin-dependent oxidoreductase [Gemmatimonadota bacte